MRTRTQILLRSSLAAVLCFGLTLGSVSAASAALTSGAIRAKQKQAIAAQKRLQDLGDELEMRGEELAQIESDLQKTRDDISASEADLAKANDDLSASQELLDMRASSIYRNGPIGFVSVMIGATDFVDLIGRFELMRRVGDSDAAIVASVKDAKARVEAANRALQTKEAEQLALRDQARNKNDQVTSAKTQQSRYVAGINADLQKLIQRERKRQEAIAARKKAEAAARARATALRNKRVLPFSGVLGNPHPEVVGIAERYLGVHYVWGGTTPAGFDCSGLAMYCYAQIGITLPRTSSVQFHAGAYIPPDRLDLLKPGDLVFFGRNGNPSRIHHVAIYAGGGDMIEAPYTGGWVWRSSLIARINSRNDYVGACRP